MESFAKGCSRRLDLLNALSCCRARPHWCERRLDDIGGPEINTGKIEATLKLSLKIRRSGLPGNLVSKHLLCVLTCEGLLQSTLSLARHCQPTWLLASETWVFVTCGAIEGPGVQFEPAGREIPSSQSYGANVKMLAALGSRGLPRLRGTGAPPDAAPGRPRDHGPPARARRLVSVRPLTRLVPRCCTCRRTRLIGRRSNRAGQSSRLPYAPPRPGPGRHLSTPLRRRWRPSPS